MLELLDDFISQGRGEFLFSEATFFGPFGELLIPEVIGVFFLESEPVAFGLEELRVEIATAEAADVGAEFAESIPLGFGVFGSGGAGSGGILEGEPAGKLVSEIAGERLGAKGLVIFEVLDEFQGIAADEPVAEAAFFQAQRFCLLMGWEGIRQRGEF